MAAGPLLAGALTAIADWRAVFAVSVIIGAPAGARSVLSMPGTERRQRRLDIRGMAAATALISGLVVTLVRSPADGWHSPLVLTAAGLALAAFYGLLFALMVHARPAVRLPANCRG